MDVRVEGVCGLWIGGRMKVSARSTCGLFIETCICPRVVNEVTTVLSFVIKKKEKKKKKN